MQQTTKREATSHSHLSTYVFAFKLLLIACSTRRREEKHNRYKLTGSHTQLYWTLPSVHRGECYVKYLGEKSILDCKKYISLAIKVSLEDFSALSRQSRPAVCVFDYVEGAMQQKREKLARQDRCSVSLSCRLSSFRLRGGGKVWNLWDKKRGNFSIKIYALGYFETI